MVSIRRSSNRLAECQFRSVAGDLLTLEMYNLSERSTFAKGW